MPINNVINTNRISELLKGTTVRKTRPTQSPAYLTKFGSIFNAPGVHQPAPTQGSNIAELNTRHSLKDLEDDKKQPKENSSKENGKFEGIDSVSGGKAAVAEGNSIKSTTQKYTKQAENDAKVVKQFDSGAQKLEKQIIKDDKQFAARFKADQKEFKKDNDKLVKLVKEQEETQKQVDNAQHELDGLLASNSFSASNGVSGSSDKSGRISELQQFIGAKVGLMQNNGKVVYSLQRNQTRTLRRLNKTNAQYIKINNINQKNMKTEQTQTNKVIEVANKVEQYSAMAQTAGQAINLAGVGLVALGQGLVGSLFGAGAGAALITIGTVMKNVGKVVELVGQYGQCAANITKTAAYAAEGNIMGAMMSAASAMQSGAAAVAGTKNLKGEFGKIDAQHFCI